MSGSAVHFLRLGLLGSAQGPCPWVYGLITLSPAGAGLTLLGSRRAK